MPNPVTKAQLARIRGVTKAALTKITKEGGRLFPAVLPGGKVDLDHEAVQAWLGDAGKTLAAETASQPARGPTKKGAKAKPRRPRKAEPPPKIEDVDDDETPKLTSHDLRGMTVEQVADQYGHIVGFGEYVKVVKAIEETRRLELQNEERAGALVEREFVQIHVFGVLRTMTRRLLRDAPKTLAKELYQMAKAGRPIEDAEKALRDGLGSQILESKTKVARALGGEGPDQAGDDG